MRRMRKKASMLSILAYLIAIIFIAVVLYKVFTFSIEKYPGIEVREISNEYDYALNAPEDVQIPHIFPATYFGGCGIGAILFGCLHFGIPKGQTQNMSLITSTQPRLPQLQAAFVLLRHLLYSSLP